MERLALDRWASPWLRNQHLARYRWSTGFAPNARVLDAACGSGYGSRLLRSAGARTVTSADLSLDAFDAARRGNDDALKLVRADVCEVPFATGSFDLYTCFETIEHVDGDVAMLEEAKRVLGEDGVLLCSTPNRELLSPGNTIDDPPANEYHVREYSIAEFRALLESVFGSVELFGQTWFSVGHAARLAAAGAYGNLYAVRLHQLRNLAGLPWERAHRHEPKRLSREDVRTIPEVTIGVCRNKSS